MVIVEANRFILRHRLAFFPTSAEICELSRRVDPVCIVSIRQTCALLPRRPNIVDRSTAQTTCIDLTRTLDAIEAALDRKSCRYEVRKAAKLGDRIQVQCNEGASQSGEFLALYNRFVRTNRHAGHLSPARLREYQAVSDLWSVYLDGRPMCGHLLVRDQATRRVRLVFSATNRLVAEDDARACGMLNRYLHWSEIERYRAEGIETFDMGGIGDGLNSIARFKLSFGGNVVREYNYVLASPLGAAGYRLKALLASVRARTSEASCTGTNS